MSAHEAEARGDPGRASHGRADIPPAEWAVAGLGAILVMATIAMLIFGSTQMTSGVPQLRVRVDSVVDAGGGAWVARFTALNRGNSTAADVVLEAVVGEGPGRQASTVTIDYLPPRSERTGGFLFSRDPGLGPIEARAVGYRDP